jgi:ppGpp synthetase/RelA/SpoT-type nucleotidyltranferase
MDLAAARLKWIEERPLYDEFVKYLKMKLDEELKRIGIWRRVDGRPKEIDSLIKKMIVKNKGYEQVFDKAGVRIILRFSSELEEVCVILETVLQVIKREDTAKRYKANEFGYQAVHYEVKLLEEDLEVEKYKGMIAEVQVKSLSQNLWSEMAHELTYKASQDIPPSISRPIYCLNALIEVADMEFTRINDDIQHLAGAEIYGILANLERQFFKLAAVEYNKELSLDVIEALMPLYGSVSTEKQAEHFKDFYEQKTKKLNVIFREHEEDESRPAFLFQPESIMIFDLLEKDIHTLAETWANHFPIEELSKMATMWGKPLPIV